MGITTFDDPDRLGLAVTLGGGEVRLLELAAAYGAFANGGYRVQPKAVLRVEDADGQIVWSQGQVSTSSAVTAEREQVLDERVAYLISDILSDDLARIPSFGDGSVLELSRPAAVKTGTTTDYRDNWTVGYTPDLVVGVWVGNADNETMRDISGISGAAPIWHDFMEAALKGRPVREFGRPDGLVEVEVCALSGLLPGPDCPHRVTELFLAGTEPTETCTMHRRIAVDRATGLRATGATPPDRIVERVYTILPPAAQEWARQQGIQQPPSHLSAVSMVSSDQSLQSPESKITEIPFRGQNRQLVMVGPDAGSVYQLDPALPRGSQRIVVSALPGDGMTLVEVTLYVDGRALARFGAPPYRVMWQLEAGVHRFWAEGMDANGNRTVSEEVGLRVDP
jgi:membrane peptidoglycan carboxypeptidase